MRTIFATALVAAFATAATAHETTLSNRRAETIGICMQKVGAALREEDAGYHGETLKSFYDDHAGNRAAIHTAAVSGQFVPETDAALALDKLVRATADFVKNQHFKLCWKFANVNGDLPQEDMNHMRLAKRELIKRSERLLNMLRTLRDAGRLMIDDGAVPPPPAAYTITFR